MKSLKIISIIISVTSALNIFASVNFTGLGALNENFFSSGANAISKDGRVVVGSSRIEERTIRAFRWTADSGMTPLGSTTDNTFEALGVSADGSVIIGTAIGPFRWTQASGVEPLIWTGPNFFGLNDVRAIDISSNGNISVGYFSSFSGYGDALIWEGSQYASNLPSLLSGNNLTSRALGISDDGSIIVGRSEGSSGHEAVVWQNYMPTGLGDLPGGAFNSSAHAISGNGQHIVGRGTIENGEEAFLWTESTGMIGLGDLPGSDYFSSANAISDDGTIVVGVSNSYADNEAFVWDEQHGMRSLEDVLIARGIDITGWELKQANDISGDGSVIIGNGINPSGQGEAWIITGFSTVPEPSTYAFMLGVLSLYVIYQKKYRRRNRRSF